MYGHTGSIDRLYKHSPALPCFSSRHEDVSLHPLVAHCSTAAHLTLPLKIHCWRFSSACSSSNVLQWSSQPLEGATDTFSWSTENNPFRLITTRSTITHSYSFSSSLFLASEINHFVSFKFFVVVTVLQLWDFFFWPIGLFCWKILL